MRNVSRILPLLPGIAMLSGCNNAAQKSNGQNDQKPNIIYIFADDLGIGDLSCYGATKVSTPNIDRLAGQGVQFTNAYATSATSTPSRFGLLTGMYPWRQKNTGIAPGNSELIIDTACVTMADMLKDAVRTADEEHKATVFGYWVNDPKRYGVAEFDRNGNCLSIEEKPVKPKSNYAVVGLYFYPNKIVDVASKIQPSARGEYEITTVNQWFLNDRELKVQILGRGFAWLDTGTHDSLSEASTYIEVVEKRQGLKIACLEAIAYRKGWISEERMRELAQPMLKSQYGQHLLKVIDEKKHEVDSDTFRK